MTAQMRIETLAAVRSRLVDFDWEFSRDQAGAVSAHWRRRRAANPLLYDGDVLLASRIERAGDELRVDWFKTTFSRFLAWREFGFPDLAVRNVFAMPALRSADGAFLLGEMGPGHSQVGELYFPGGTPDLEDLRDGEVDLGGSLLRELLEETGIAVAPDALEPQWRVVFDRAFVACMKIIDWPLRASEIVDAVERHIDGEERPELSRAIMVRTPDELADPRIPGFVRAFLAHALAS